MKIGKVGIYIDQKEVENRWSNGMNVFELYILEVFEHLRLPFQMVEDLSNLQSYDALVIGVMEENPKAMSRIVEYAEAGGTVISYGGLNRLADWLGFRKASEVQRGYAFLNDDFNQDKPLRFLQAEPWEQVTPSDNVSEKGKIYITNKVQNDSEVVALHQIKVGKGHIDRWAISIPKTIVGIQQGTQPVSKDGVPAPDGSANLDEGILKADDGFELDWNLDREQTGTGIPYFSLPYADLWREVMIEHLLNRVIEKNVTLPFLAYWPADVEHMAMISHDSDLNEDASAITTLDVLRKHGIHSTWCMIMPGYDQSIYEQVKNDGHELAFHYNALKAEEGIWGEEAFREQLNILKKASNTNDIVSNKNHYTRFEGWGEFFTWCEKCGIEVDQSRGPSKKGNIGFLFGTCHPFFPIASADENNRFYNVLELGFLTQDLNHHALADTSVIDPFLNHVKLVNGVAHFLFHQYHIHHQEDVYEAIQQLIVQAKQEGFTFWTSRQINEWERKRRKISIIGVDHNHHVLTLDDVNVEDAVAYIPIPNSNNTCNEKIVERFGIPCIEKKILRQSVKKIGKEMA
ncbi:hypothetical protein [Fredinandcohnia quinoae]|uniref:NodB homology domain-containing protein n=1 Tax=Fredinandcohnia quinoae TaxID=2918902 RepID=A0AAW5DV11_9BACI|nr:hypothetical protein [Fredinandcohnia sp. SECRCQ15]MCH1624482.1 hypothetical protein [Fredinandcohnia sp. SECRCQ15]